MTKVTAGGLKPGVLPAWTPSLAWTRRRRGTTSKRLAKRGFNRWIVELNSHGDPVHPGTKFLTSYSARGLPLQVYLKGLIKIRLKYSIDPSSHFSSFFVKVKLDCFNKRRTRMVNQISTWLSYEVCLGI